MRGLSRTWWRPALPRLLGAVVGLVVAMGVAGEAAAFFCHVENKPTGAGSAATIDINCPECPPIFNKPNPGTEDQPHGAFATLDFGDGTQADVFLHIPQGGPNAGNETLPPVANGVQDDCDGKGLGDLEACFGP